MKMMKKMKKAPHHVVGKAVKSVKSPGPKSTSSMVHGKLKGKKKTMSPVGLK